MADHRKPFSKPTHPNELRDSATRVGRNIQLVREAAGFEQEEVARRIGIHRQTLSKYERGAIKKVPSHVVTALAAIYAVSSEDLLTGNVAAVSRNVSRGTSVADEPAGREHGTRESFAQVLKRRLVLEWLLAFRDEVRGFGADQTEEDAAIDMVTSPPSLRYLTNKALDELSEGELLDAMESLADVVRKRLRAPSGQMKKALAPAPTTSDAKGKGGGPSR